MINAGRKQCKAHLQVLKMHFADSLSKVRQHLSTPKLITQEESSKNLTDLLNSLLFSIVEKIKGVLQDLVVFLLVICQKTNEVKYLILGFYPSRCEFRSKVAIQR